MFGARYGIALLVVADKTEATFEPQVARYQMCRNFVDGPTHCCDVGDADSMCCFADISDIADYQICFDKSTQEFHGQYVSGQYDGYSVKLHLAAADNDWIGHAEVSYPVGGFLKEDYTVEHVGSAAYKLCRIFDGNVTHCCNSASSDSMCCFADVGDIADYQLCFDKGTQYFHGQYMSGPNQGHALTILMEERDGGWTSHLEMSPKKSINEDYLVKSVTSSISADTTALHV